MRALALVLIAACSYKPTPSEQLGTDSPPPPDGEPMDTTVVEPDGPIDAFVGPPPTACVERWLAPTVPPFANEAFLSGTGLNSGDNERDPFLSTDQLRLYFSRVDNTGDTQVWTTARTSTSATFGTNFIKLTLSTTAEDSKVAMTGDDLMAFVANRRLDGEGAADLWEATRAVGDDGAFDAMTQVHLGAVNDAGNQLDPHVSPDGLRLYLSINDPQQLAVASRTSKTASFSAPTVIPVIGSDVGDADPTLTADERVIIFSSQRTGVGGTDLWYATRPERDQPFGAVQALPFNGTSNDADPHISGDGCTVYFASDRAADFDLYVAKMQL